MTPAEGAAASHRQALRAGTAAAHARLDARFAAGVGDAEAWRAFLRGMHGFVCALQAALPQPAPPHWRARLQQAGQALEADLRAAGAGAITAPSLVLGDAHQAWGAMYVFEGSALGGALLRRQAPASRFLALHAGDRGRGWRAFVAQLERLPARARPALAQGALAAFAAADEAFAD